jgi:hypothetical protein
MGIQSDYLDIPPSRGIDSLSNNRKWALWGALGFLALSIFAYFYFKRYYSLDWKLDDDDEAGIARIRAAHAAKKRWRSKGRLHRR